MQWRVILAAGEKEENIEQGQRMEKLFSLHLRDFCAGL